MSGRVLRVRLWLARWLVPAGWQLVSRPALEAAAAAMRSCVGYTERSGHLTRAFHAGKRVRAYTRTALEHLGG